LVMEHDATDTEFLAREHVDEADIVVAALDSDEKNLLVSMLAKRIGTDRIVAVVDSGDYVSLFEEIGIDIAINPRQVTAEEITRFTHEGVAENVAVLENDQAEVLELELTADSHGLDAARKGARAFHIAGAAGTSNVLAGRLYGLPVKGTMAHSYIQAHEDEQQAFLEFTRLYPDTVLLVDTYDTLQGVDRVIRLARELGPDFRVTAIRLDSGDLGSLSRQARERLDAAGLQGVGILVSGGLDEDEVDRLLRSGAPIDGFGVGTAMGISTDAPDLDMAYKLCEYAGRGRLKLSTGKPVLPGRKQVFRRPADASEPGDVIARAGEALEGESLLQPVMADGRRLAPAPSPDALRQRAQERVARLPAAVRGLSPADPPYPVRVSEALQAHQSAVARALSRE
ncbi:MAG: nicotinate phosphoribosyltransferase, partial [Ectothiorhodospira sp.]